MARGKAGAVCVPGGGCALPGLHKRHSLPAEGIVGRASEAPPGIPTLAEDHLRPARQPGGDGAEIIAPGNRDARQLLRQRFFDQR